MPLSIATFVALRYMKASRENRFFSWVAFLSIAGISIGVAAMIVVLGVINGFETELRQRFLAANAHILAYRFPAGMESPVEWKRTFMEDFGKDISAISFFVHNESMVRKGSLDSSVMIRGILPDIREKVQSLAALVTPPDALAHLQAEVDTLNAGKPLADIPAVIVGAGLISIIDAKIGDTVDLVSPDTSNLGDMQKFRIVGIYNSGLKHYDNRLVIMSLPTAQRFNKLDAKVTGLEIGLRNPRDSLEIQSKMSAKYPNLTVKDWQSFSKNLFDAMQMERAVIAIIVALVGFVAGFNILTTLFIAVTQKQRDISVLKAIGASNMQIMRLFLSQGLFIGFLGAACGAVLAVGVSRLIEELSKQNVIKLPDLYLINRLPVSYDWKVYASVACAAVFISVFAGIYPAFVASRVEPSEGFRGGEGGA